MALFLVDDLVHNILFLYNVAYCMEIEQGLFLKAHCKVHRCLDSMNVFQVWKRLMFAQEKFRLDNRPEILGGLFPALRFSCSCNFLEFREPLLVDLFLCRECLEKLL